MMGATYMVQIETSFGVSTSYHLNLLAVSYVEWENAPKLELLKSLSIWKPVWMMMTQEWPQYFWNLVRQLCLVNISNNLYIENC
jgi:hypothetical protein